MNLFDINSYNFELEESKIAQIPANPAHNSKMLVFDFWDNSINNMTFKDLPEIIEKDRILFFNDSKVLKSRIKLKNIKTITRAWKEKFVDWEIFFLKEINSATFEAMVNPGEKMKPKTKLLIWKFEIIVKEITYSWRILEITNWDWQDFLNEFGQMPLPPYIEYSQDKEKYYQPIFAKNKWSVASPTASLHFTKVILDKLKAKWIESSFLTLHIWLGTFKPIYVDNIKEYEIHEERIILDENIFEKIYELKKQNKKIVAVWTTSTRILESLPYLWRELKGDLELICPSYSTWLGIHEAHEVSVSDFWNSFKLEENNIILNLQKENWKITFDTKLFIFPWFEFKIIDELITNFHLPKSTLLVLVSTFLGYKNTKKIYNHALVNNYRFFSFGDVIYLKNKK